MRREMHDRAPCDGSSKQQAQHYGANSYEQHAAIYEEGDQSGDKGERDDRQDGISVGGERNEHGR